jgi:hypothetical protein
MEELLVPGHLLATLGLPLSDHLLGRAQRCRSCQLVAVLESDRIVSPVQPTLQLVS